MNIAILGSTSQIAKDLILSFSKNINYDLSLFSRNVELMKNWVCDQNLKNRYRVVGYDEFNSGTFYDVVINFVGAGDPAKIQEIGHEIITITEQYDDMAIEYIQSHNQTRYIFLSSGVVFGGDFQRPVDENTSFNLNNESSSLEWYVVAKQRAEKKHRSLPDLPIVDVRVFNYFSHTQDMNARLLMADIVRAITNKAIFETSPDNVVKDFITPPDFYSFINAIINFRPINIALDCYTKAPVAKFDLLSKLEGEFGLRYKVNSLADIIDKSRVKMNYYSTNAAASGIGYQAQRDSMGGIIQEIRQHLK